MTTGFRLNDLLGVLNRQYVGFGENPGRWKSSNLVLITQGLRLC